MKEGFYSISYTSTSGARGFGLIAMDTDILVGVDVGGVEYDGTYQYDPSSGMIEAEVKAKVPSGANLVTGAADEDFDFKINFPRETTNTPFTINTPGGPVNAVIKFLRHFPN